MPGAVFTSALVYTELIPWHARQLSGTVMLDFVAVPFASYDVTPWESRAAYGSSFPSLS